MIFRRATESDVETLRHLASTIWREYYPGIISGEQVEYMLEAMYSAEVIRSELARGVVWELVLPHDPREFVEDSRQAAADARESTAAGYLSFTHDRAAQLILLHKLYVLRPELFQRSF